MQFGKYYRDSMDPSRLIVPISSNGKSASCRVYFYGGSKPDFAGMTEVPVNLFTGTKYDPSMAERIGFVLAE